MSVTFYRYLPRRSLVAASACLLLATQPALAGQAWVITDHAHPVHPVGDARLIELDQPQRIENALSADLPADSESAQALMRQRLASSSPHASEELAMAYQGVVDAWQAGVTRIPAVVLDGYVLYGDSEVSHARDRIAQFQREHPQP